MTVHTVGQLASRYGQWAMVCGASEGLGAAFANELANRGMNVVLVARRADVVAQVAAALTARTGRETKTVTVDLSSADAVAQLAEATKDLDLGLVVYNAAFAPHGEFLKAPVEHALMAVDVNVKTPVALFHAFGNRFAARGRGAFVMLSSLTAFQGSAFLSTYGATKAFGLTFAEGLWVELGLRGVDVLAVCAGATRTPGFERTSPKGAPGLLEPAAVAFEALDALGHGPMMIPGVFNRFASFAMRRLLPRRLVIKIMADQGKKLGS